MLVLVVPIQNGVAWPMVRTDEDERATSSASAPAAGRGIAPAAPVAVLSLAAPWPRGASLLPRRAGAAQQANVPLPDRPGSWRMPPLPGRDGASPAKTRRRRGPLQAA
jgi:hypothetical protein